jgi:hypothetical protein
VAGEVTLEKGFVDGHILDGHQPSGGLELDNPVDQQKGVTVWKETQDLLDVERHSRAPKRVRITARRSSGL